MSTLTICLVYLVGAFVYHTGITWYNEVNDPNGDNFASDFIASLFWFVTLPVGLIGAVMLYLVIKPSAWLGTKLAKNNRDAS